MQQWRHEIRQAFLRAFLAIANRRRIYVRQLVIPVAVLVALALLSSWPELSSTGATALLSLLTLIFYSIVAVRVHRIVLLSPSSDRNAIHVLPSMRYLKYAAALIAITILAVIPVILFVMAITAINEGALASWAGRGFSVLMLYFVSRFSLVLPSIAIDDSLKLLRAFQVSRWHQISLFFVVGMLPLALSYAVTYAVVVPLDWAFGEVIAGVGGLIAYVPAMIFEISVLSGLFQQIRETWHAT